MKSKSNEVSCYHVEIDKVHGLKIMDMLESIIVLISKCINSGLDYWNDGIVEWWTG